MGIRDFIRAQEDGQKAFPYRVELTDAGGPLYSGGGPASYNDYNGLRSSGRVQTPLAQRNAPAHMQTYGGNEAVDWVFKGVNRIATSASNAEFSFEDDSGKKLVRKKLPVDPPEVKEAPPLLVKLFDKPNPYMVWADLCELTLVDWLLVGNAYWVKWGSPNRPVALYRMCPEHVRIIPGRFGPEKYRYHLPGDREYTDFEPEQVMHFMRPNPHDPYYGMGLVQGNARPLDMEIALTNTQASYYEHRGMPSGVVSTDRRVPRDVFRKLKAQMQSFFGGAANAGKLMVLENGLKYDSVSPSAQDALFTQMGQWSRDRALSMFNLNKGLLGMSDKGDGDPKLADWQLLFDRETMIPVTKRFARMITDVLVQPGWNLDFKINYEETLPPDQALARAQTLAPLPGVKVKELRAAAGLPPSTGDKEIDETVLNMPQPNLDATGQGGGPDPNLKNEPGRPPIAANVSSFGSTKQAPAQRKPSGKKSASVKPGKKSLDDIITDMEDQLAVMDVKAVTTPSGLFFVADEAKHAIERSLTVLERSLLDAVEHGRGSVYQRAKNSKGWKKFERDVTTALEEAYTEALSYENVQRMKRDEPVLAEDEIRTVNPSDTVETLQKQVLDSVLTNQRSGAGSAEAAVREGVRAASADISAAVSNVLTVASDEGVA